MRGRLLPALEQVRARGGEGLAARRRSLLGHLSAISRATSRCDLVARAAKVGRREAEAAVAVQDSRGRVEAEAVEAVRFCEVGDGGEEETQHLRRG